MNRPRFVPTDEQTRIVTRDGSAFVAACPGAGKTRVLVERARRLLSMPSSGQGIALLSFTRAAISELDARLRRERLVGSPSFPHFVGTFDAFLWQFFIVPFGIPGCTAQPRLIPDKDSILLRPYAGARALPLGCFAQVDGRALPERLARYGFTGSPTPYETTALKMRGALRARGELDFDEARNIAMNRLHDRATSSVLARAFAARFLELIVDEAQDCNPVDLEIIQWFRTAGIPIKVICDPDQAIYAFRGGVTRELQAFAGTFRADERLLMTGNFRSSRHIVDAVAALRRADSPGRIDEALGQYRDEPSPVHIFAYHERHVPNSIGVKFHELTEAMGLDARECPVVAATRATGAAALGYPVDKGVKTLSYRLAVAVCNYHVSFEAGGRKQALENLHSVILALGGYTTNKSYHQYILDNDIKPGMWRPRAIELAEAMRFGAGHVDTPDAWLDRARTLLSSFLPINGNRSIAQQLTHNRDLASVLSKALPTGHPARTIHSVKGAQFPAVCVVMSTKTAKGILDSLTSDDSAVDNEESRKIYVGVSRACRLLVIAVPHSQADRLANRLQAAGTSTSVLTI